MTRKDSREVLSRATEWLTALACAVAWGLLAANAADAQEMRVPDIVLAQTLGRTPEEPRAVVPAAPQDPAVSLVANRLRQDFEDQLVAGVARPSVELEVHFDFDSARIHEESGTQIEAAARLLNHHFDRIQFRLAGYTDAAGEPDYNRALSQRRAEAVWAELVERHGVDADRLEPVGYGEDNPLGEVSAEKRRRVELQILRGLDSP